MQTKKIFLDALLVSKTGEGCFELEFVAASASISLTLASL